MAQYNFSPALLLPYLRERFQLWRFGPLVLMLYLAHLVRLDFAPVHLLDLIFLCLLTLSFRLMDDLFDVAFDRVHFPTRVLSTTHSIEIFVFYLLLIYLVIFVLLYRAADLVSLYLLLGALLFFVSWYHSLRALVKSRCLHSLIVLLKYPLFLLIIEPSLSGSAVLAIIYLSFVLFEFGDDPWLRKRTKTKMGRMLFLVAQAVYAILLLYLLCYPVPSQSAWAMLVFCLLLQSLMVISSSGGRVCIPFITTTLLLIFLSLRTLLP